MAPSPAPQASKEPQRRKRTGRADGGIKIAGTIIPFDNDVDLSDRPTPTPLFPVCSIPIDRPYINTYSETGHEPNYLHNSHTSHPSLHLSQRPKKPKSPPSEPSAPASTRAPSTASSTATHESGRPSNPPLRILTRSKECQHTAKNTSRNDDGSRN